MKNMDELIAKMGDTFEKVEKGFIKGAIADTLANIAGKMINGAKVQIEYNLMLKKNPESRIKFMEPGESSKHNEAA